MALINCPECGKQVYDKVKACPHCGYPIGGIVICSECNTEYSISEKSCPNCGCPNKKRNNKIIIIVSMFLILVLCLIIFWIMRRNHVPEEKNLIEVQGEEVAQKSESLEEIDITESEEASIDTTDMIDTTDTIGTTDMVDTTNKISVIEIGENVTIDDVCDFSIDYSNITNDVMPPNPASFYTHYEADDGKVFVDICFAYKNMTNKNVGADDVISASLKYADKYEYTGFSMIEKDSRSSFTYSNITSIAPLSTEYIHYLFEVPEELSSGNESIIITFIVSGNVYSYTVR